MNSYQTMGALGLGSNLGDREENLSQAFWSIKLIPGTEIFGTSKLVESEPWGNKDQADYLNVALSIRTYLTPEELMEELLAIEVNMGRVRQEKWGARIIDIDILFYGDIILNTEHLTIPHSQIPNRKFVLLNLNGLIPGFYHPVHKKKIRDMLTECSDPSRALEIGFWKLRPMK